MAGFHDLFCHAVVQHGGLCALLHEHQVLNVAFRAFDGAEIQPAHGEAVGRCVAHRIVQHLTMGGRVAHDAVLADLFAAGLELRLDQTDAHGVRCGDRLRHREDIYIAVAVFWIVLGFIKAKPLTRRFGLALILLASAKLCFFDFPNIGEMGRTLLFIGFGITLLAVSFAYGYLENRARKK